MNKRNMNLSKKKCKPCEGGTEPLKSSKAKEYLENVSSDWKLTDSEDSIKRRFNFDNFKESVDFANKVAKVAEEQNHHPDIHIFYDEVVLELTTHAISGLSENDFIVASKVDKLVE
ncbi:MAG: 4a-hydroxytetrahydrobiopterin dehydratase [Candidatus Magasanikbacteria bacterium]